MSYTVAKKNNNEIKFKMATHVVFWHLGSTSASQLTLFSRLLQTLHTYILRSTQLQPYEPPTLVYVRVLFRVYNLLVCVLHKTFGGSK